MSGNENFSTEKNDTKSISFDELMKNPQQPENNSFKPQNNFQPHHNNLMQFQQRPQHYHAYSQQHYGHYQGYQNQNYAHNSMIGYQNHMHFQQPQINQNGIQNFTLK